MGHTTETSSNLLEVTDTSDTYMVFRIWRLRGIRSFTVTCSVFVGSRFLRLRYPCKEVIERNGKVAEVYTAQSVDVDIILYF